MTTKMTSDEKIGYLDENIDPELEKVGVKTKTTISSFEPNEDWEYGGYLFAVKYQEINHTVTYGMPGDLVHDLSEQFLLDNAVGLTMMNYHGWLDGNANQGN